MTQTNKLRRDIVEILGEFTIANDACVTFGDAIDCANVFASQIIKACKKAGLRFVDMPEGFTDEGIEEIEIG